MTKEEAIAIAVGELARSIAPKVKELGDLHGPAFVKALWPEGAPAAVTWTMIWERQLELARKSTDELVRRDVEIATERGQPWPGGASIRPETAARVAKAEKMLRAAESRGESVADMVLFRGEPPPERFSIEQLVTQSATGMLWLARQVHEGDDPVGYGELLGMLTSDVVSRFSALCRTIRDHELADMLDELLSKLHKLDPANLVEISEHAESEPPEPKPREAATRPLAESADELVTQLARMAEVLRRITPSLVELIERDLFKGAPPARVSFPIIMAAINRRVFGDHVPERVLEMHRRITDFDLPMPDDDDPHSTLDLIELTADCLEGASERLLEISAEEREEIAPAVEMRARMLLWSIVGIAHVLHHQLLVAEIATAIGADPVPFPKALDHGSGGSA